MRKCENWIHFEARIDFNVPRQDKSHLGVSVLNVLGDESHTLASEVMAAIWGFLAQLGNDDFVNHHTLPVSPIQPRAELRL